MSGLFSGLSSIATSAFGTFIGTNAGAAVGYGFAQGAPDDFLQKQIDKVDPNFLANQVRKIDPLFLEKQIENVDPFILAKQVRNIPTDLLDKQVKGIDYGFLSTQVKAIISENEWQVRSMLRTGIRGGIEDGGNAAGLKLAIAYGFYFIGSTIWSFIVR